MMEAEPSVVGQVVANMEHPSASIVEAERVLVPFAEAPRLDEGPETEGTSGEMFSGADLSREEPQLETAEQHLEQEPQLKDAEQHEAAAFHKTLDQVKTTPETFRDDGFGKESTFGCLVAEVPPEEKTKEGHRIIGYQFHYVSYCTWDGPILFGEDLYVMPDFRGTEEAGPLKACAKPAPSCLPPQIALQKGCSQFRFISARWNQPAMNFYTKLGAVNVTDRNHWIVCHIDKHDVQRLAEQAREQQSG
ncbi:hypothetical protein JD844_000867 [Phrynosoma platyrhinos]|uniref:N-acetyltransferase domain-containing protein n=1 Tax=Phrynosoma platyrhinos TaxID=52577 RepID=A0ABQ7T999_PHRPL|nr:hypothetical protein JD844_000867 [Phrynosoma platyrhinos]